jgi:hypothetical protein
MSIFVKMELTTTLLLFCSSLLGSVSTSMLFSTLFEKTTMFSITILLILVVSAIIVMFGSDKIQTEAPSYVLIFPATAFLFLMQSSSYFSLTPSKLFENNFGSLLIWSYVESFLFIVLALIIDRYIPLNGYAPPKK